MVADWKNKNKSNENEKQTRGQNTRWLLNDTNDWWMEIRLL